jgi:outer membrane protein TolC
MYLPYKTPRPARLLAAALPLLLSACAGVSADGGVDAVASMTRERLGQPVQLGRPGARADVDHDKIAAILKAPLTPEAAVQLALLNNAGLKASLAGLGVSEADLVQAGRLRNPSLTFTRVAGGGHGEIDRGIGFDVIGLLTMPARQGIEQRRFDEAKLAAAAQAVRLALDTRRAYFTAVAAAQTAQFMAQAKDAAEASAELADGMARAGNWSQLDQARQQLFHAETIARAAHAAEAALAARERLLRLLGLGGDGGAQASALMLPERLPDLPAAFVEREDIEAQAMRQRLDVQLRAREAEASAASLGLTKATRFVNVLEAGYANKGGAATGRQDGYAISLELPLFDWGQARTARAEAVYMQAVARTAETAVRARSEVRLAYAGYRHDYELARHYQDTVLPLRERISAEVLLRYNGMLASIFDLLADAGEQIDGVNASIVAQRDFWIAETDLQAAVNGADTDN